MKSTLILVTWIAASVCPAECKDLIVGTSFNTLLWQEKVEYPAIPFNELIKEVFFFNPRQQIIKGIIARDLDHTDAIATVTAGGVGQPFATINLKSQSGSSLNYQIEIFVV